MPKKFIPTPELLQTILTRYEETHNYAAVSRETGISANIIKRIISENTEAAKPVAVLQSPAVIPQETQLPSKAQFYYLLQCLVKEQNNV